ncbi:hypothetical protein ATE67_17535 [Sphingopyxis sp. H050]|nr:hypothetical protein ATE67_17535 [Sphingopyxis sp. H050]
MPVRSVIAPPQQAQKQMPVSSVGPPTAIGGIIFGLRALSDRWTASNSVSETMAGTSMMACSLSGFGVLVL